MKNIKVTLESTVVEFNKWREKRKAGDVIPDSLWDMVTKIYDHYPHTVLCQQLNLKLSQLKAKGFAPNSQDFTQETIEKNDPPSFVHVPPATAKEVETSTPIPEMPSIEIHRPDGVKVIFKHHDNAQLAIVLQQLIGG